MGMLQSTPPRRRGRPPRHPIDVLFAQLWFFVVKARSGLPSAYAMELSIEPHLTRRGADGLKRPRKWDGYEAGRRVPERKPGKIGSIEWAEDRFPGTAKYLESPLRILLREEEVTLRWIDNQLRTLPSNIVELLFEPQPASSGLTSALQAFDLPRAQQLAMGGSFDALVATTLLMKRAELIQSPELRRLAWVTYLLTQSSVAALPGVSEIATELFMEIDIKFPQWLYPRPDHRVEVITYTNAARDESGAVNVKEVLASERLVHAILTLDRQLLEHRLLQASDRPMPLSDLLK